MSALGHKRTFAPHQPMSALPPKADTCSALADVCFGPIADISERLFQNHIGSSEQCRRYREPERFGSFQIYDQLIFGRRLHRQVCWLLTSEDAIDIARRMAILVGFIGSIGCKAASRDKRSFEVDRR